jgi:hypothetical protein
MSKALHTVVNFEYTYTVTNVYEFNKSVDFDSLSEVKNYILGMVRNPYSGYGIGDRSVDVYDLVNETGIKYRHNYRVTNYETKKWWQSVTTFVHGSFPFLIRNQLGAIISAEEVASAPDYVAPPYTGRWWTPSPKAVAKAEARLTNKKNAAKIKAFHKTRREVSNWNGMAEEEVESVYRWWLRNPKTRGEIRATEGHNTEDEDGFKFGRASRDRRLMPQAWSDIPVAAKRSEVSWKTNSKRRKQWKPKGE